MIIVVIPVIVMIILTSKNTHASNNTINTNDNHNK